MEQRLSGLGPGLAARLAAAGAGAGAEDVLPVRDRATGDAAMNRVIAEAPDADFR